MSRLFYHVMQDYNGNLLTGVTGTMRIAGTGTLVTVYGDEALTIPIPNPMTNHPSFGSFKCYLPSGSYDFQMAKAGYTFETLTGVQGLGTMATQDASGVVITGGSATFTGAVGVGITPTVSLDVNGDAYLHNTVGVKTPPIGGASVALRHTRSGSQHGVHIIPDADSGAGAALAFFNAASSPVGSIATTGAATAFNTSSDARLKTDVDDLTGELAVIQALRPVSFRWRADDTPGVGFLAQDVADVVPGVITGERDAVHEDGTINPQMIDHSKLVVWLVGACKTLAAQNEALQARLALLEDAVGV
jgi:hypothetical protein